MPVVTANIPDAVANTAPVEEKKAEEKEGDKAKSLTLKASQTTLVTKN